jgi:asparagine synthase (glutamine-hydrolysing)
MGFKMCGIAGCIGKKDVDTVNLMLDSLLHRGPDERGIHINGKSVFGHTRLSIVDVMGGRQPILSNNGSQGIICNGEIYNFRQIRKRLSSKYQFKTQSDSEVILQAYKEKGPECVKELDGIFAFAIFDGDDFMLARDPIGIKPLYYGYKKDTLYFTSELGAMSLVGLDEVHEFPAGHYYTPKDDLLNFTGPRILKILF